MMKLNISLFAAAALLLTSCEGFLSREPIAEIGSGDYFTDEKSLVTYTNGFLQKYTPDYQDLGFGDGYSDIVATKSSFSFLTNPSWNADLQGGWSSGDWNAIYNINYFLAHFREVKGVSEAALRHYEGTARFWRAWKYWSKVKTFGAVPWYDAPIDPSDIDNLYKGRDSREFVMDKVLEDLTFACENCYDKDPWINNARVNKFVALALKSRICLFEGTYRKYHSVDPSTGKAWEDKGASERFLRECVKADEELISSGAYSLVNNPADVKTQYRKLFTQEAVDHTETIWALERNTGLTTFHSLTWYYTSGSMGERWSLDQDFVKTYLNLDGSRHTATGESFTEEVKNRDYRLQQCVITPGYSKLVGGVPTQTAPDFAITLTGYQVIKFNIDDKSYESASICYNSLPIFRYAEILLDYAEAKAELGEFNDDVWNKTIKPLRERSGVDGKRPAVADSYLQGYYGISDCDILEIRRERAIELLLEGRRYDDLMRWHLGELLNKQWYGIYIPAMDTAYDLNNDGINDVCVVKDKAGNETGVSYIVLEGANSGYTLENGNSGRLVYSVTRNFEEKRYLRPIPKAATNINENLGQNYYWR